jgi:PKD repeat protein
MGNKFYSLLCSFLFFGLFTAHAQDSSRCNASFYASISGNQVNFRAMDSLQGLTHNWNFGDSTVWFVGGVSVTHTYNGPGRYTVRQVVTGSGGCVDSSSQVITIDSSAGPLCGLSISASSDSSHHLYRFVAIPILSGGTVDTISWMINDSLAGRGDSLANRYLPDGSYSVCATLSTSLGCHVQSCVQIIVMDSVPGLPVPPDSSCRIAFTAVPNPRRSNEYDFTVVNSAKYDSIVWFVADSLLSGRGHGPVFHYTYTDTGYYNVTVEARFAHTCNVSSSQIIHIDSLPGGPGGYITAYPNPATTQVGLTVSLTKAATIDIRVYNSMGNQVELRTVSGYPGENQITLPIANLPIGVYYIQLQYGNTILKSKIQKL